MNFVLLHNLDGWPLYFHPAFIAVIEPDEDSEETATAIYVSGSNEEFTVMESAEEVLELIKEAWRNK